MKTILPTDCGNSPRINIVGQLVTNWAKSNVEAMTAWLADEVSWTVVGRDAAIDEVIGDFACPVNTPIYLKVHTIVTHGRLASCDGFFESESSRIHFSHVFTFSSTSKTAKIRESRTYLVDHPD